MPTSIPPRKPQLRFFSDENISQQTTEIQALLKEAYLAYQNKNSQKYAVNMSNAFKQACQTPEAYPILAQMKTFMLDNSLLRHQSAAIPGLFQQMVFQQINSESFFSRQFQMVQAKSTAVEQFFTNCGIIEDSNTIPVIDLSNNKTI